MKKRISSLLMAFCLLVSLLTLPAGAANVQRYSDISDQTTANAAEVLRLMGVMDGYSDGSFKPNQQLNRAQFCKMTVYAMNKQGSLGLYRTVTVFPDVKPSHWAAAYINLSARTSVGGGETRDNLPGGESGSAPVARPIIAGFPDGKFHPERVVSMGQAVTILLRVLGYQDKDIGGVWPDSYMATGAVCGLTKGLPTDGNAPLTRAQAAKLFVNLLQAKGPSGATLYTLDEEPTELLSVDGGSGMLKTSKGSYPMLNSVSDTNLVGLKGRLVSKDSKALTFLPDFGSGSASVSGAVVLYENGATTGFTQMAGNSNYKIYKNGSPATAKDLRKYDVATYYPDTNSILVTDIRLTVYYESAEPSQKDPAKIQVLGGSEFYVLPTARDTLRELHPGDQITLLLTPDGQVAAAMAAGTSGARSNVLALVTPDGSVELLCGKGTIKLAVKAEDGLAGDVVRISSVSKDKVNMEKVSGGKAGALNVVQRTVGGLPMAEGVMIFENGQQINLSQLSKAEIPASEIRYARTNWAGQVDLVVIDHTSSERYGRVFWEVEDGDGEKPIEKLGVETGEGQRTKSFKMKYGVQGGDYVAFKLNRDETGFSQMVKLAKLGNVSWDAWMGDHTVTAGGRTYEVPANVQCYNAESKEWTTLDKAKAYAETADLYVKDGVVRIVEVR